MIITIENANIVVTSESAIDRVLVKLNYWLAIIFD
jgi:hypothetical protein